MIRILHIEDDIADQLIFERTLKKLDLDTDLTRASKLQDVEVADIEGRFDIVFCDYNLPDGSALDFIQQIHDPGLLPTIVVTSLGDLKRATASLKSGAFDYITKSNIDPAGLERAIKNATRHKADKAERKRLEKELALNYANTTAILENTVDGIWSVDTKGRVVVINSIANKHMKIFFNHEFKTGEDFFSVITEPYKSLWDELRTKAEQGENANTVGCFSKGEVKFYMEVACSPIYADGKYNGVTYFARDVTDREESENKIRQSEKNFRTIFESSDLAILIESKEDFKILDLNQACADLHGYDREKMLGMSIFQTIPQDHLKQAHQNFQDYKNGKLEQLDSFVYTSDKQSIPVNITVNEIYFEGKLCNQIYYQDISARKETERKLQEARELAEQSAEFKSRFLANMSHEIRTPLNAMVGFIDLLFDSVLSPNQQEYLQIIKTASEDLLVIINDILDLSKIEAGKMVLKENNFSLNKVLNHVQKLHQYKADDKGIVLSVEQHPDVDEWFFGDEVKITQVINNLVSNALKFTDFGSVKIHVLPGQGNNSCKFEIIDTGAGIPEDQLESIFDSFTQLAGNEEKKHKGTGLGLSIVSQLVALMGGEIRLESELDAGTKFTVELPLDPGQPIVEKGEDDTAVDLSGLKVLLCEDNELNVLLAQKNLNKLNVNLMVVSDGSAAISAVKSFDPEIILMDIRMPLLNGYEATKRIRSFSKVPIIAMTAHVLDEERNKCVEAGMNDFIPKPFKQHELFEVLSKYTEGENENPEDPNLHSPDLSFLNMPLLELHAEGDLEFVKELFRRYLNNTSSLLADIDGKPYKQVKELASFHAHKMHSAFKLFEFTELNELALKIESGELSESGFSAFLEFIKKKEKLISANLSSLPDYLSSK